MGEAALEQGIESALSLGRQLVAEALVEVSTVSVKGMCEEELRLKARLFASCLGEHPRAAAEGLLYADARSGHDLYSGELGFEETRLLVFLHPLNDIVDLAVEEGG